MGFPVCKKQCCQFAHSFTDSLSISSFFVPCTLADVLEEPEGAESEDEESADGEGAAVVALHVRQPDDGTPLHHGELQLLRRVQAALSVEQTAYIVNPGMYRVSHPIVREILSCFGSSPALLGQ